MVCVRKTSGGFWSWFPSDVPIGIFFIYSSFLLDGAALAALAERDQDHSGSAAPVLFLYNAKEREARKAWEKEEARLLT